MRQKRFNMRQTEKCSLKLCYCCHPLHPHGADSQSGAAGRKIFGNEALNVQMEPLERWLDLGCISFIYINEFIV